MTAEIVAPERSEPSARTSAGRRTALGVVAAGLIVTLPLYLLIAHEQSQGRSPAALQMSTMGMADMGKYWAFPILQASGLAGLAFAWGSVFLGLQQSGRVASWLRLDYRQVDRLHRYLSLLVITLVAVHVLSTVFDAMGDSWRTVLLLNQWKRLGWAAADTGYDTGVIAMYVLAVTAPTFYVRRGIGAARWRVLHRLVIVFYALSIWHALILGLDVAHYAWLRPLMWLAQIPLLAMLARRVLQPARTGELRRGGVAARVLRYAVVALSLAGIVAVLAVVLTGNSGFIATV